MPNAECSFLPPGLPKRIRREGSSFPQKCCTRFHAHEVKNRATLVKPALLFVTPNGFCQDYAKAITRVQEVISAGASLVQIRDRGSTADEILKLTDRLLRAGVDPTALSLNGVHPEEARALTPAVGIHIREADIDEYSHAAAINASLGAVIGCSVHSVTAAELACEKLALTYLQVGTMFNTNSHPGKIPEGPALLRAIRERLGPSETLIGVGGIQKHNLHTVFKNGASGVAVISSISAAHDARRATSELHRLCRDNFEIENGSL